MFAQDLFLAKKQEKPSLDGMGSIDKLSTFTMYIHCKMPQKKKGRTVRCGFDWLWLVITDGRVKILISPPEYYR
jgi:hypothetical protein